MPRRISLALVGTGRTARLQAAVAGLATTCLGAGLLLPGGPAPAAAPTRPPALSPTSLPTSAPAEHAMPSGDLLVIPALSVRAPLVRIAMSEQRVLTPPRNPREVGYWDRGAPPGSSSGQTLITGHTLHAGGGALDRLGALHADQRVTVYRGRVAATYRVTTVRTYRFVEIAREAQRLFGQQHGRGRLVLVTCTGWDGREYHANVVVSATPVATTERA